MEYLDVVCGYLAWIGGDSAKFSIDDFDILDLNTNQVEESLQFLKRQGFVHKVNKTFSLTRKGSYAVDFSLLSIIGKWAYKSAIWSPYPFETLQWLFTRSQRGSARNMLSGIKSRYVLSFCQKFLESFVRWIPGYTMKDYSAFRDFVLKISLCPIYSFSTSHLNDEVLTLLTYLLDRRLMSTFEAPERILTFNTKEMKIHGAKQKN